MVAQVAITPDPQHELATAELAVEAMQQELRDAVRKEQEEVVSHIQHIGSALQAKVDQRVSLRSDIEQRWLRNIRQINGIYEREELPILDDPDAYGSRTYVPLTRRLRNMAEARLSDILFPSDARGYTLDSSPVADLVQVLDLMEGRDPESLITIPSAPPQSKVKDVVAAFQNAQKDSEIRVARMERQIDDRLAEGRWSSKARQALSDAIDFGTGVVKGPVATMRRYRSWSPSTGFTIKEEIVPTVEYVPLWNFYPDMSATRVRDCVDIAEAHYKNKLELRALRNQPGFISAAIDMVLATDPVPETQSRRNDLRQIAGLSGADDPRYAVWEYHGPISGHDLNMCERYESMYRTSTEMPAAEDEGMEGELPTEAGDQYDEEGEYRCCVWFCNGIVIKFAMEPLAEGEDPHVYRVIYWQRDKSSIFGYGLPDEVRDQQNACNGSFRAMMDNMGFCVGPMTVFNDESVEPMDGKREIRPLKQYRLKQPNASVANVFAFYQPESRINELLALFNQSKAIMDEVATMPAFGANAEQTPNYTQSATGASLAYQTSTMWVRRVVRHWDDDIIEPTIGGFVEWEMNFNPDDSIKGDFKPIARGVTGLIELEGQGPRVVQFIQLAQSMGVPTRDQLRMLRQLARTLKLDPDEVLPSEEEIKKMKGAAEQPDIEQMKLQTAQENNRMDHQAQMRQLDTKDREIAMRSEEYARREKLALLELAAQERSTMEKTAAKYGYDLKKLESDMANSERQRQHEAQMQNSETAVKLRTGSGL